MASFRSGVQIISHISKNQECQLRNLRSYSKDRFSVKCCRGKESQVEKCPKPRPTKSWLSLFKKREPSTPEDGESKPPKRSTSWLTFWRQPEIDAAPLPPRYTCRLELERRRYKGELTALKEGRTPHAWEPDVMVITEDCHDPIVCHSMTEAYPHQPPRPHPNRLARCRSSERRQTRYKDARLQETKPDEEWRHIKDQGAFYMAVRTECPRKEDPPAGYRRRTCPEHKGIEMRSSRLSWCEAVKNIEMDSVAEFPKHKTYEPTPRESKGVVIPECTLRKDGTSSPLATQDRFQEPVHVSREVSTLQTRTCGGVRKVPIREDREEVNDTRLQEIPYGREDTSSEVTDHKAEKDPECRVEPTKTPDAMEVSEVVCDQAKNSPARVKKSLISEEEKGDTMTTSGHCLSSYLKNKEGKPNACKHKLCVEECAPRAFPTEGGCDSVDLKEKCVEDSRRVVPPTNDPESMIADPDARVRCDISKPSPDDSKKPRGRNFSTLSSSPAFSLDHHSTMPLIRNSCRSVACKMMHTSTKTNTCVSSVLRKKDRRWCDEPLDSDPVQGKTKKLDQHVCEKQSSGSVNISNSGKCGKEGKPNLVCSKKKNVETKQRPGSEIAVNVLECKDRPSKKVKNSLSKNYAPVRSTKLEDNNIKLKKLAHCPTVEKTMPPPASSPDQKRHKLPEERKSKECLEEIKLKECLKVEVEVAPPSCKGKENTKNCNLQKSTDICDSKNTSKRSMNSTTKMRKSKKGGKKAISHSSFSIYSLDNKFKTHLKFQGYCRNMSSDEQSHMPILKNQSFRNEEYSTLFYGSLPKQFTKGSFNGSRIPEPIEYLKTRKPERKVPDFNFDHTTFLRKTNYTPQPVKKFLHASALGLKSKDSKKTGKKESKRAPCEMKELEMKEPESLYCPAVILPGCSQPESIACSRECKIEHVSDCHRIPRISNAECVKDHPPTPLPSECDCPSNAYKSSLSGYNSFNSSPLIYSGKATFNKASANMVVHERQVGLNKSQSLPKVMNSFKSNLRYVRVRPLETKEWQPTIRSTSKKQVKRKCEEVRLKTRPSKVQDETGLPTKEKVLCNQISDPEWHIKPNEEEKVIQVFRSDEKQKFEKITESNKTQIIVPNVTQISNATKTTFLRRMKTWFSFLVPTPGVKEARNNNLNDSVTIHHQSHASQEREEKPDKNRDDDILKHTLSEVCVNNPNKDDYSSPVVEENKNSFILDETQVDIKPTETKFKVDTAKVELFIPNINVQNDEKRIKSEQNKVSVSQNTTESIKLHDFNTSQRTIGVEAENTSAKQGDSVKKTKGNIERTTTPPLEQETFNPLSHFYDRKIVKKPNMTPDKPSRYVSKTDYTFSEGSFSLSCKMRDPSKFSTDPDSYKSRDKTKPIMAKIYCDEIIESKETDECRMKDKLSDPNIILSVNERDENVFELTNDTKRQIKMCSEEQIQSKSSIQIEKSKTMLDKVDTPVFQKKYDTTQTKGLPKHYFRPQTTNKFLNKATNDPKKIPVFLFPDSQYSKIINLNNGDPTNIDNKRKLSMIMLQYKQIFEEKSFNSKGDSFGHQSGGGGGSKSKCNEHENHPSCEKTHVNEMVYSGEKINYSELNTAEQNEGHNYSSSKSKTSDPTYTDEKTSRYNSHLKYPKQKLTEEIEICANTRARPRDSEICIDKNSNMEIKVCKKAKPRRDPCLGGINNKYKTPSKIPNKKEKICAPLNEIANLETSKTRKEVELPSKLNCVSTSCDNNNESERIRKPNPLTSKQICQTNSVKQKICGEKSQVSLKDNSLKNTTKIIKKRKPKHYKIEENIKYSLEKGGQGKCSKCSKIEKKLCPALLGGKVRKSLSRKKANKKRQSPDEALNNAAENLSVCKTLFETADKLSIVSPHQSGSSDVVSKRTILLLYEEKVDGKSSKNKTNESPKCSKQFYKETNDSLDEVEESNKVSEKLTQYQKCKKTKASPAVSIQIKKEKETCPIKKASKRYTSKMRRRGLNLVPVSTKKNQPSSASYSTYNAHHTPLQFQEHDKHVTSQNNKEKSSLDRLNNENFKKDMKSLSDKLSEDETSNSKLHEDYSEINTKQDTDTLIEEIRKCNMSSLTTVKEVTRTNLIDKINGFGKIYYSNKSGSYTQRYDVPTYSNNKLISHSLILRRSYSEYKAGDLNVPGGGSLNLFRKITEPRVQISRRMKSTDSKDDSDCRFKDESNSKKGKIDSASGTNNKSNKVQGTIENDPNVSSETTPCGNHLKYVEKSTTSRGEAKKEEALSDKREVKKETSSSFFKIPSWCKSKPMKVETNTPQNGSPTTKTEIAKSPTDCGKTEPSPLCGICVYKNANKISPGTTKSLSVNASDAKEVCSKTKSEKLSSICVDNEASKKSEISSKMLKKCRSTPVCGGKETAKKDETGGLKKDLSTSSLVCGKEDSRKLDPNILRTEPKCPPDKKIAEKLCPRIQDSIPPPSCTDKSKSTCPKVSLNSSNCKDSKTKKCSQVEYSKAPSCANRSKSICPKLEMSKCKEVKNNTELEKQTHPNTETFEHSPSNEITDKSHIQKSKPVDTTASPTNEDKCHPKSNDAPDCKYPESPRVTCMTTRRQAKQFSESKGGSCESTISCPPRKDPTPKAPVCKTHHKSLEKIIKQTSLKDPPRGDEGTAAKGAKRQERPKYEPRTTDKEEKEDFSARQWMEKYGHKLKKMRCPPAKPTVIEIPCEVAKKPQPFLQCKGEIVKEQPTMVNTGREDSKKTVGEKTDERDEKREHDLGCRKCQWGEYQLPELGPDGEVIRADEKWPFQKKGPETEN